jgi:alkylation response protein AidB-like acyl-CoA dehydrogenase
MSAAPEVLEVRALARDFAAAELRPHTEHWDAQRSFDDDVPRRIAELGFFGMLVPEDSGGMGFDLAAWVGALEELAWGEPGVALMVAQSVIAADALARFGGSEHAETLAELAAGERLGCVALAADGREATAGASADGWTFGGTSPWVTNADRASLAIVAADVDGAPGLFALGPDSGYRVGDRSDTMGLRAVSVMDIALDGARASSAARLDWSGTDAGLALEPLRTLSGAAIAVGIAQAALEHAVAYAGEREQFGRAIRTFEGIQYKLAEMAARSAAARALTERAAQQPEDIAAAAIAKLTAGACAMFVTTEAVQIFGGYGYMRDYPVEKLMRDAKAMDLVHGTSEMLRLRIAASLYAD